MAKYRKKPVEVEALRWDPSNNESAGKLAGWLSSNGAGFEMLTGVGAGTRLGIRTLEGLMLANPGDWIIRGVNGEFYPCKPDIFEKTYEALND